MYRFSIFLLFITLPCIAFAQTDTLYFNAQWKKATKDSASYYRTARKQPDGRYYVRDHYLDGHLQMTGYYKNPSLDESGKAGKFVYYDSLGNIESEGEYSNNKRKGTWMYYYGHSDNVRLEENYTNDTNIVKYTFYDSITHKKVAEGSTLRNNKDGAWKYYYSTTGDLQSLFFFKNGLREGNAFFYDSLTGDIRIKCKFLNDLRTGAWGYYSTSGNLYSIRNFNDDLLDGTTTFYDTTSQKKTSEADYRQGKLYGKYYTYYPNGRPSAFLNYVDNRLQGDQTLYYPNGNIKLFACYIHGRNVSNRQFYENGTPASAFMSVSVINQAIEKSMKWYDMEDTSYYTKSNEQCMPDSAYYYRVVFTKPAKKRYKVEERFIAGNKLKRDEYSTNLDSLVLDGTYITYDTNGDITEERNYRGGHPTDVWKTYYPGTDQVWTQTNYRDDKHAKFKSYFRNGKIKRKEENIFDTTEDRVCYDSDGNKVTYTPFTSFPSPLFSMNDFLGRNLHYPPSARDMGVQGRVIVAFLVQKDGTICQMHVIKNIGGGCDEEAMRVLALMPKWKPGMIDDVPADMYYRLSVSFKLE